MNIGELIREYRNRLGLSQAELAENICSVKYIYLIEKGERTPSTVLLSLFSEKLHTDLCAMYPYLGCLQPIEVRETMVLFEKYKRQSDFESLKKLTEQKKGMPDFQCAPWVYDIEINQFCYSILAGGKAREAIAGLKKALEDKAAAGMRIYQRAQLYSLLSICYHMINDGENSFKAVSHANMLMEDKRHMLSCRQVLITVKINYLFACEQQKQYEELIAQGLDLLDYQQENNSYERIHYTCFLLALAYHRLGENDRAAAFCKKTLYVSLTFHRPEDIRFFMAYPDFAALLNGENMDKTLVSEFCGCYGLDFTA